MSYQQILAVAGNVLSRPPQERQLSVEELEYYDRSLKADKLCRALVELYPPFNGAFEKIIWKSRAYHRAIEAQNETQQQRDERILNEVHKRNREEFGSNPEKAKNWLNERFVFEKERSIAQQKEQAMAYLTHCIEIVEDQKKSDCYQKIIEKIQALPQPTDHLSSQLKEKIGLFINSVAGSPLPEQLDRLDNLAAILKQGSEEKLAEFLAQSRYGKTVFEALDALKNVIESGEHQAMLDRAEVSRAEVAQKSASAGQVYRPRSAQETQKDFAEYIDFLWQTYKDIGSYGREAVIAVVNWAQSAPPKEQRDRWETVVASFDSCRVAYYGEPIKFVTNKDYSCNQGLEERLILSMISAREHVEGLRLSDEQKMALALVAPFVSTQRTPTPELYRLICQASGGSESGSEAEIELTDSEQDYEEVCAQYCAENQETLVAEIRQSVEALETHESELKEVQATLRTPGSNKAQLMQKMTQLRGLIGQAQQLKSLISSEQGAVLPPEHWEKAFRHKFDQQVNRFVRGIEPIPQKSSIAWDKVIAVTQSDKVSLKWGARASSEIFDILVRDVFLGPEHAQLVLNMTDQSTLTELKDGEYYTLKAIESLHGLEHQVAQQESEWQRDEISAMLADYQIAALDKSSEQPCTVQFLPLPGEQRTQILTSLKHKINAITANEREFYITESRQLPCDEEVLCLLQKEHYLDELDSRQLQNLTALSTHYHYNRFVMQNFQHAQHKTVFIDLSLKTSNFPLLVFLRDTLSSDEKNLMETAVREHWVKSVRSDDPITVRVLLQENFVSSDFYDSVLLAMSSNSSKVLNVLLRHAKAQSEGAALLTKEQNQGLFEAAVNNQGAAAVLSVLISDSRTCPTVERRHAFLLEHVRKSDYPDLVSVLVADTQTQERLTMDEWLDIAKLSVKNQHFTALNLALQQSLSQDVVSEICEQSWESRNIEALKLLKNNDKLEISPTMLSSLLNDSRLNVRLYTLIVSAIRSVPEIPADQKTLLLNQIAQKGSVDDMRALMGLGWQPTARHIDIAISRPDSDIEMLKFLLDQETIEPNQDVIYEIIFTILMQKTEIVRAIPVLLHHPRVNLNNNSASQGQTLLNAVLNSPSSEVLSMVLGCERVINQQIPVTTHNENGEEEQNLVSIVNYPNPRDGCLPICQLAANNQLSESVIQAFLQLPGLDLQAYYRDKSLLAYAMQHYAIPYKNVAFIKAAAPYLNIFEVNEQNQTLFQQHCSVLPGRSRRRSDIQQALTSLYVQELLSAIKKPDLMKMTQILDAVRPVEKISLYLSFTSHGLKEIMSAALAPQGLKFSDCDLLFKELFQFDNLSMAQRQEAYLAEIFSEALKNNQLDLARRILDYATTPSHHNPEPKTRQKFLEEAERQALVNFLVDAVEKDHQEIVHWLIENGYNINGQKGTKTALSTAVKLGNMALVDFLLEQPGIDINKGETLHWAIQTHSLEVLQKLVQFPQLDPNYKVVSMNADASRLPLGEILCLRDIAPQLHIEILETFLKIPGLDVNADSWIQPPIQIALENPNAEHIVPILLADNRINLSVTIYGDCRLEHSPLTYALEKGMNTVAQELIKRPDIDILYKPTLSGILTLLLEQVLLTANRGEDTAVPMENFLTVLKSNKISLIDDGGELSTPTNNLLTTVIHPPNPDHEENLSQVRQRCIEAIRAQVSYQQSMRGSAHKQSPLTLEQALIKKDISQVAQYLAEGASLEFKVDSAGMLQCPGYIQSFISELVRHAGKKEGSERVELLKNFMSQGLTLSTRITHKSTLKDLMARTRSVLMGQYLRSLTSDEQEVSTQTPVQNTAPGLFLTRIPLRPEVASHSIIGDSPNDHLYMRNNGRRDREDFGGALAGLMFAQNPDTPGEEDDFHGRLFGGVSTPPRSTEGTPPRRGDHATGGHLFDSPTRSLVTGTMTPVFGTPPRYGDTTPRAQTPPHVRRRRDRLNRPGGH